MFALKEISQVEKNTFSPDRCKWKNPEHHRRIINVIELAKKIFENSAILKVDKKFTKGDVTLAKEFIISAQPDKSIPSFVNWNEERGPAEHFEICSLINSSIAEKVYEKYQELPDDFQYLMEIVGLLHDIGRFVDHQFYTTDLLTDFIFDSAGINHRIKDSQHSIDWYWNVSKNLDFNSISLAQRISVLSDVLSKRSSKDSNRLRRIDEIVEEVKIGKLKYLARESHTLVDKVMRLRIAEYSLRETYVLSSSIDWIRSLNIDIDSILENIEKNHNRFGK